MKVENEMQGKQINNDRSSSNNAAKVNNVRTVLYSMQKKHDTQTKTAAKTTTTSITHLNGPEKEGEGETEREAERAYFVVGSFVCFVFTALQHM